ncbi:hypothetical protein [Paraburkholderia acidisoli]|uniref:Uncharacterized protein n=1 Tax=Paraburkholderia acidisoli TaxID=2571748 RepID=A0A7Z2JHH4_9BURK|nr:hypothetical protein [Paraburkholderia acidisoli]QGZ64073.1 hypothetical protein FAZ98_20255 [Paraburkholderia acidisoli]
MADPRRNARVRTNADRAYELQPVRSRAVRLIGMVSWIGAAAAASAGATWWLLPHEAPQCPVISPDALSRELSETQLRLEQERAARATLQTAADAAQASVSKLQTELLFLRNHRVTSR